MMSTKFEKIHGGVGGVNNGDVLENPAHRLYPPLAIPEPNLSERRRLEIQGMRKYKNLIDETRRKFHGDKFTPTGYFKPPDFSGLSAASKARIAKSKEAIAKKLEELAKKTAEDDMDTEDDLETGGKDPGQDGEGEEQEPAKELDEDDEEIAASEDSDVDDYTANAGFDDDEVDFNESGGEGGDVDAF